MYTDFGPLQRHEGKPENGEATSLVGNPDVIWTDGDNSTFATIQYGGFEDPWGHPYAQMLHLPLDQDLAMRVEDVIVTWTARLVEPDPTAPPDYEFAVSPFIRLGAHDGEGSAGPSYHSMGVAAWWGSDAESLIEGSYEGTYLPRDGSWVTLRDRMVPIYTDASIIDLLQHKNLTGPTKETMRAWGVEDVDHSYAMIYQDSFWSEDKFAVSEVTFEFVGLTPETVIQSGGTMARARFT